MTDKDKENLPVPQDNEEEDDDYEEIVQDYDIVEEVEKAQEARQELSGEEYAFEQSGVSAETEQSAKKTIAQDATTSLDPDVDGKYSGRSFTEKLKVKARTIGERLQKIGMMEGHKHGKGQEKGQEVSHSQDLQPDAVKKDIAYDAYVDNLEGQQPGERGNNRGGWER